ncbi:MAG: methyltransferase, partial [Bacteroidaceae bacterium]|nr:methyltransferase [Bacteroidaceae bacterium]
MRPFRFQQFTIHQSHAAMKVGTDSDLLGALSVGGERILDIGTGTGVLALMMAQRCPEARITAVEIDGDAVIDARRNFQESPFADRITLLHTSFQQYLEDFAGTSAQEAPAFDSVVCNPPYF